MAPLNPVTHPENKVLLLGHSFRFVYLPPGETIGLGISTASYVGITGGRIWHLVSMYHNARTVLSSALLSASYWMGGKCIHLEAAFSTLDSQDLRVGLLSKH